MKGAKTREKNDTSVRSQYYTKSKEFPEKNESLFPNTNICV